MISLDAILILLTAAFLPAVYLWVVSRWLEPEYRKARSDTAQSNAHARQTMLVEKAA